MSESLNQWKNTLDATQITQGMNAARKNAKRLLKDAEALLELRRYPSAVSLAILSVEESGKIGVLRQLATSTNGKELKEAWKAFRSHTKKNISWVASDLVKDGARKLEDFFPMFHEKAAHPKLLDNLKQISFYTDCLGRSKWSIPEEVIDQACAKEIVELARLKSQDREHTVKEVELWISYLKPVEKNDVAGLKKALVKWRAAMVEEGLLEKNKTFDMLMGI